MTSKHSRKQRGNAMIELVLIAPWFFLLFTGLVNAGITTYGLIAVQNAARVAAEHTSENSTTATDRAGACALVISQLKGLPAIGSGFTSDCSADPVRVSVNYCDGTTPCAGSSTSIDGGPATFVTVTYSLPHLFQLPLANLSSVTRSVEMRLRDNL